MTLAAAPTKPEQLHGHAKADSRLVQEVLEGGGSPAVARRQKPDHGCSSVRLFCHARQGQQHSARVGHHVGLLQGGLDSVLCCRAPLVCILAQQPLVLLPQILRAAAQGSAC